MAEKALVEVWRVAGVVRTQALDAIHVAAGMLEIPGPTGSRLRADLFGSRPVISSAASAFAVRAVLHMASVVRVRTLVHGKVPFSRWSSSAEPGI
jgi:hypothetical protein